MKGDITLSTIIENLLMIGFALLILYLLYFSKMFFTTSLEQESNERYSILLANGLISHEKLVYEKNGRIFRGILDAKKLDALFYKTETGLRNESEFREKILNPTFKEGKLSRKELDIGYNQLTIYIYIIDLNDCNENKCVIWAGVLLPIETLDDWVKDNPVYKFFKCMYESFDNNWARPTATCAGLAATGAIIGGLIGGPVGALIGAVVGCAAGFLGNMYSAAEWENCIKEAGRDVKDMYVSKILSFKQGLPVNIIYEDGSIHVGRIIVGIVREKP